MNAKLESHEKQTQDNYLEFVPYTEITDNVISKKQEVVNIYRKLLRENDLSVENFESLLDGVLNNRNIQEDSIIATKYENNRFYIYLDNGKNIKFSINDIQDFLIAKVLDNVTKVQLETRAQNINSAIESIYSDNEGALWNDEINDEDILETDKFGLDLKGKTLKQLKELLDIENTKLLQVYRITGESKKQQDLLKNELQYYVGIGDKYEGGARYFSMSTEEINRKVAILLSGMNFEEIFTYIKTTNETIEDNYKKSDMVNQVNLKFINALYTYTFDKLKKENASNRDFIEFAKVITGRGKRVSGEGEELEYSNLEIDSQYKSIDVANKALIHVMLRKNGVIDNMTQKVEIQDEELEGKTPSQIMIDAQKEFGRIGRNIGKTGEELIAGIGFGELIGETRKYNELSFDEKIHLGAIKRMTDILQDMTLEDIQKDPNIIHKKLYDSLKDSYEDLNYSLSDNFDGFGGICGKTAKELGLTGDLAEIFDLYQDVNGNAGFFDFSDSVKETITPTWQGSATLALGIISAGVFIAMLPVSAGTLAIMGAGAAAGATTGFVSQVLGRQGYDTLQEATTDTATVIAIDGAVGSLFFLGSIKYWKSRGINILELSLKDKRNIADMVGFGGAETITNGMFFAPIAGATVKQGFNENHFDTDITDYHTQLELKRKKQGQDRQYAEYLRENGYNQIDGA